MRRQGWLGFLLLRLAAPHPPPSCQPAIMADARLAGRLHKELKLLQDPPPGVCVWPADDCHLSRLHAQIQGPDGTVYAKGIFKLDVEIPDRYPFEPPNVKFITPVYHPNIDSGGRICHDILNMPPKGQWRPSLNIGAVLASIRVLLEEPNHDDGLMSDISAEYKHNRALFDDKARQCTERHAMQNTAERDTSSCHDIDQAKAVTFQSNSLKNQTLEKASQDTLRPLLEEVNRLGTSTVTHDEPSTSTYGVAGPRLTPARPRQNLAAKLSLAKGVTAQKVRSCCLRVAEAEPISSLGLSSENERPRETEVLYGQDSQLLAELNGSSVADAGKGTVHKPDNVIATKELVESVEDKPDSKAPDNIENKQPALCTITKDTQPNAQTLTSQSSPRTSMPERGKKLMLPKTKLLKLSRPQSLASQVVQENTPIGKSSQSTNQVKGTVQLSKEPVILLDSESDDENFRVQVRSQGAKRKYGHIIISGLDGRHLG